MTRRRGRASARLALVTAALSAGCSPDPYRGERGMVLHLATAKIRSLDPAYASDMTSSHAVELLYEGLYAYHPFQRPHAIVPAIAEGPPEVSPDGRTLVFRIRPGARFCDDPCFAGGRGREVSAGDFVYAWKRIADARVNAQGWWVLEGKVRGLDAFRDATRIRTPDDPIDRDVEGLRAIDARTLRVELVRPDPQFLWLLTMPYTAAIPREAVERYGEAFARHPVGAGPFALEEFVWGWRIKLRRNPNYRDERFPAPGSYPGWEADAREGLLADAGERVPFLDGIVLHAFGEPQPEWLSFLAGYLDRVTPPEERFAEAVRADALAPSLGEKGIAFERVPELELRYIALNTKDPILANADLRRALCLAADIDWMIEHLEAGRGVRVHGPIPPGLPEYDPGYRHPYAGPDRARAREFLARAGYPEGKGPDGRALRLTMDLGGASPRALRAYEALASDLRAIGIELVPSINTWARYIEKIRTGQAQIWELSWVADYPDAQNFLAILYGPNASPGPNGANYANPAYDALYERFRELSPGPERTRLARRLQEIANEDCPWIPCFAPVSYILRHRWVRNHRYPGIHWQAMKYIAIDTAARARDRASWNRPNYVPLAGIAILLAAIVVVARRRR
ncbi:MAG: hypothetical protein JXP34_25470 [Planctomycetes bacterium]|nr:hypothetical protein [Planctomycetota bacterium]